MNDSSGDIMMTHSVYSRSLSMCVFMNLDVVQITMFLLSYYNHASVIFFHVSVLMFGAPYVIVNRGKNDNAHDAQSE